MQNQVSLSINTPEIKASLRELKSIEGGVEKALNRAINDTLKQMGTKAAQFARKRYTYVDAKVLKSSSKIIRASGKNQVGQVSWLGRRGLGLRHFSPSPKIKPDWKGLIAKKRNPRKGVSSKILRSLPRKIYLGSEGEKPFWAKAKQGFMALFIRPKKAKTTKDLQMLFGPSAIQALLTKEGSTYLQAEAQIALENHTNRAVRAILKGYLKP